MWAAAMGDVPMLVAFLKSESKFPSLLDAVRWPIIMLQFCFHCIKKPLPAKHLANNCANGMIGFCGGSGLFPADPPLRSPTLECMRPCGCSPMVGPIVMAWSSIVLLPACNKLC